MNRDVGVGSDLACADLSLELHTVLLTSLPLISCWEVFTQSTFRPYVSNSAKSLAKPIIGAQNIFRAAGKPP
jgi:hypothetical protein